MAIPQRIGSELPAGELLGEIIKLKLSIIILMATAIRRSVYQ
jgi:hypothetical protein